MYVDFKEDTGRQAGMGSGLLWMLSGVMMGLLVGLAMYYFANRSISSVEAAGVSHDVKTANQSTFAKDRQVISPFGAAKDPNDPETMLTASLIDKNYKEEIKERPEFSYYAVLPALNVPIQTIRNPTKKEQERAEAKAKAKAAVIAAEKANAIAISRGETVEKTSIDADKPRYVLQIASYKKQYRANKAKNQLNRKGMTVSVEQTKVRGRTWFRLMAGPVDSQTLKHWKAIVISVGHQPLVYPAKQ